MPKIALALSIAVNVGLFVFWWSERRQACYWQQA